MGFGESIEAFFKNIIDFKDSSPRAEYWYSDLFLIIVNFAEKIIVALMIIQLRSVSGIISDIILYLIGTIFSVVIGIASLSVTVRRFHDAGHTGWWCVVPYILLILALIVILLIHGAGTVGIILCVLALISIIAMFIFTLMPSKVSNNPYQHPDPVYQDAINRGAYLNRY